MNHVTAYVTAAAVDTNPTAATTGMFARPAVVKLGAFRALVRTKKREATETTPGYLWRGAVARPALTVDYL